VTDTEQRTTAPAGPPAQDTAPAPEEFPLTDLQVAYMVGMSNIIELGGRQNYYIEMDAVDFDPARAEQALNQLIDRQEHLRTIMLENGRQRVMTRDETPHVPVAVIDMVGRSPDEQEESLRQTRDRMSEQGGLDTTGWPLFQVAVTRLRPHRSRVHLRMNLILLDGPSLRIVVAEWWDLYHDPDVVLPPIRVTFKEWRMRLLAHEQTEAFRRQWRYWEDRLDDLPEAPQLPLARQPRSIEKVSFTGRRSWLTRAQWEAFGANFRKHRVLPTTGLIHVYAELLGAWSASQHFCLNLVHQNVAASHEGSEGVVGQRSATLPLEVDLRSGNFWERARRLQRQLFRDMSNSDITAVRVSRELAARRGWTQRAALPYVFTSNQGPGFDSVRLIARPAFRLLDRIQHTPQVLVDDQIRDAADGGVSSMLDFVEEAFPPDLPGTMVEGYRQMLAVLGRPDGAELEPDPVPAGHRSLIADINDTAAPRSPDRLEHGFLRQAAAHPDAAAVVTSGRTLTYRELDQESAAVSRWLTGQQVGPGDIVPVVMTKGWEQVVAVLGVLRSGAAYCPIDATVPGPPMRAMLDECAARVVLSQSHADPDLGPGPARLDVDRAQTPDGPAPEPRSGHDTLAYVIYTSGTTGRAKGVMIDHAGAVNTVLDVNQRIGLGPGDRVFGISSLAFDLSVWDVFGTLAAGATLVLPVATSRPDPIGWADAAAEHGVTVWNSVPALAEMLVEVLEQRPETVRPPLRTFLLSGDWIPTSLPGRMRALWPGAGIVAMGGATEASIWSNVYEVTEIDPDWRSVPYGRPLTNQTMRVLDDRLDVRPPWAVGRIYIGGIGLARGYLHDDERTAERFIQHPRTGERLYWTGDLGRYLPDGDIEFLGREDRQVKVLGYRVEPGAIETATRTNPRIRECVVCVDRAPGGQARLALLAVPQPGEPPTPEDIAAHLRGQLPHYMVPGRIHVVDSLPLTGNGKVDMARALASLPRLAAKPVASAGASPLTKWLADLLADLLDVPSVSPDSNFFELGGNSLLALRAVNRIRAELGIELSFVQVFEAPTVGELAAYIEEGGSAGGSAVRLAGGEGPELFLFQVLGGSVAPYVPLAQGWPGPVRAFQGRGHVDQGAGGLAPDLVSMAAEYLEELRRYQPEGPYALAGWSMGGSLAYEVATQLAAQGQRCHVFLIDVVLLDMVLPESAAERHLGFMMNLTLGPAPEGAEAAIRAAEPGREAEAARDAAIAHGLLPPEVGLDEYHRLFRVYENDLRILAGWRPQRLDEPTLLLLAEEETDRPDPGAAWRQVCPGIEVVTAPGNHFTIGADRRLEEIGRRMAAWMAGPRAPRP
jgi:amino acid adenylation domain-containing protein